MALSILLANPFHFWMPDILVMCMLTLTVITFVLFALFILREKAQDEREVVNKMLSGRVAFIAGSGVLVVGIIIQELHQALDPWLVLALVVMVLAKLFTRIYRDSHV